MAITTNKKIEIVEETKEIIKPVKTTKKETNTEKKVNTRFNYRYINK